MRNALWAEIIKVRSLRSTPWILLAAVVVTVGLGAGVDVATLYKDGSQQDVVKLSLTGIYGGQVVFVVLAVLIMTGEYSERMVQTTFVATPRRHVVFVVKAIVVATMSMIVGTVAVLGSLRVGRLLQPVNGFTPDHGFAYISLTDSAVARAAFGTVLYLTLLSLLAFALGVVVRESAAAIGITLGMLFLFPLITAVVGDGDVHHRLEQLSPMTSGFAVQSTRDLDALAVGPWVGLLIVVGWATVLLGFGLVTLVRRDV